MAAAAPVVAALRQSLPGCVIAISTQTAAGMAVARRECAEARALFYLPFDWPQCVGLALWRLKPDLMVVVEKELWPNLLGLARLMGAKVLVVNGRVSDRMMWRMRWAPGPAKWLYRLPHVLCVQSEEDARRLGRLGVTKRRITVAGNTKVDDLAWRDEEAEARLAAQLGVDCGEMWLIAGSTHQGEEQVVVEAFRHIRERIPSARLLLAPRHLERVAEVSALVAEQGLAAVLRSEGAVGPRDAVVVLDTMGELRAAYGLGVAGFVGGTLVPIGGHNLLEPVAARSPVFFGEHTENCVDVADLVLTARVGLRVTGAQDLAEQFVRIAEAPALREKVAQRAGALIEAQRGASPRCAQVARSLLEGGLAR
jgi:3-deoxy-D-manno-octulosonic-acid transferase